MRRFLGRHQTQGSHDLQRLFWTSSVSFCFFFFYLPYRGFESRNAAHFWWLFHVWAGGVQPRLFCDPTIFYYRIALG